MPQVYDNRNERVRIGISQEGRLEIFIGNSEEPGSPAFATIDVPTAEDLRDGLIQVIDHLKATRRGNDGY